LVNASKNYTYQGDIEETVDLALFEFDDEENISEVRGLRNLSTHYRQNMELVNRQYLPVSHLLLYVNAH
jgi:hypothetical protein